MTSTLVYLTFDKEPSQEDAISEAKTVFRNPEAEYIAWTPKQRADGKYGIVVTKFS